MGRLFFVLMAVLLGCYCASCNQQMPLSWLAESIGEGAVSAIKNAPGFSIALTKAKLPSRTLEDIELTSEVKRWDDQKSQKLKDFLLDDANYEFALIPKNLFIPSLVIQPDESNLAILYSISGHQLKFLTSAGTYTFDLAAGRELPCLPSAP